MGRRCVRRPCLRLPAVWPYDELSVLNAAVPMTRIVPSRGSTNFQKTHTSRRESPFREPRYRVSWNADTLRRVAHAFEVNRPITEDPDSWPTYHVSYHLCGTSQGPLRTEVGVGDEQSRCSYCGWARRFVDSDEEGPAVDR